MICLLVLIISIYTTIFAVDVARWKLAGVLQISHLFGGQVW